ncbi:MAG: aldo/keto reductase [Deltaproteobacteria bacterium]|nr:aldo/keto reductase [Deltaproteobacteria bacterium]
MMGQQSCATPEGTAAYRARMANQVAPEHFRQGEGLWLSSVGLGTYLGDEDEETDLRYAEAVTRALQLGCNVLDSAINYRHQRSERVVGRTLAALFARGTAAREEIVVATKGGFIPFDGAMPADPGLYFRETYLQPGIVAARDVVAGCHCMAPRYIQDQLERSRRNLGLACVDIYYLHNPETQLQEVSREEFHRRIRAAFEVLEAAVAERKIRVYGTATWTGYRQPPTARDHLSLEALVGLAREVGGEGHHFRVVQLPYNLAMLEAFTKDTQVVDGEAVCFFEAARRLGITAMVSAPLLQSQLATGLPPGLEQVLDGLRTDAQRAIQFVRSTPGVSTALVGMKSLAHVEENLGVARVAPAPEEQFMRLFTRTS